MCHVEWVELCMLLTACCVVVIVESDTLVGLVDPVYVELMEQFLKMSESPLGLSGLLL